MSTSNPYRPGVGLKPLTLAGRESELRRFEAALRSGPEIPANIRMTGLRGVGKSVLLWEMADRAVVADWSAIRVELEPRHNSEQALLELLGAHLEKEVQALSRLSRARAAAGRAVDTFGKLELKYQDFSVAFDPTVPKQSQQLTERLGEAAKAAEKHGRRGLVLLLDEAQVLRDETAKVIDCPLSMLLAAVTRLQQSQVPLALVLCGLPPLATNLQRARSYTERMFRGEEIGSLRPPADAEAFTGPLRGSDIRAADDLLTRVLRDVDGYPFFIQLWGAELWEAARQEKLSHFTVPLLRAVQPAIYERLDRDFYRPRFDAVTPAEQDLLLAASHCSYPPLRVPDVNKASPKSAGNVNVLLGRLVTQGLLYRVRKGEYSYTAPHFHEFLGRHRNRTLRRAASVAVEQSVSSISGSGYVTTTATSTGRGESKSGDR